MQIRIIFITDFFNSHQKPLSDALYRKADDFHFISVSEQQNLVGRTVEQEPPYASHYYEDRRACDEWIDRANVVILGDVPRSLMVKCTRSKKIVFFYSERPLKNGDERFKFLPRWIKWHLQGRNRANCYLLAASAFAAADFGRFGLFKGRAFKWGYFPELEICDESDAELKAKDPGRIIWCGRLVDWKHPEEALRLAERLHREGIPFRMNIIGDGSCREEFERIIDEKNLRSCVEMTGSVKPEVLHEYMEKAGIFIFTSDRKEGWGAVLNEAMNRGMAAVASDAAGSVPFLIDDGENGLIYHSGDSEALYRNVKSLLEDPGRQRELGEEAYNTIRNLWNAETAAERLLALIRRIQQHQNTDHLYSSGPCSKAESIPEEWYIRSGTSQQEKQSR